MLEVVHGDVIDAARVDLWASSLGQVDACATARTQNPRHQVEQGRLGDSTGRRRVGRRVSSPYRGAVVGAHPRASRAEPERDLGVGHWARAERDEKRLGARALGAGVELHYLDAPLDELIQRAERRNASGEWTAAPMTRAHFEEWATIFQPPDEEEILLFDKPVAEG
jgi:hypothetical protein